MSRDAILEGIRAHRGDPTPAPVIPAFGVGGRDEVVARFKTVLEAVGGTWVERTAGTDLAAIIRSRYPDAQRIVSTVDEAPRSTVGIAADTPAAQLATVELAILRGRIAVAENAAVWIDDRQLPHRGLPFVAEHCVLLLRTDDLVADLHAAYSALAGRSFGWGAFVSGPSKTADIEQSLVIGAQGAKTLLVVME